MSIMVARKEWWDQLTIGQRQVVKNAWPTPEISRTSLRAEVAQDLLNAEALGIIVHQLSASDRELWKQATAGQTERLAQAIGGRSLEVLNLIETGKKQFNLIHN
jgi:TRAP-type C4-dicarboxylate transport system substrate-binding protein